MKTYISDARVEPDGGSNILSGWVNIVITVTMCTKCPIREIYYIAFRQRTLHRKS